MRQTIINRISIFPQVSSGDEYEQQIDRVSKFCRGLEDGILKPISFSKIKPKPLNLFLPSSKEEDEWELKNWGARSKAKNGEWTTDSDIQFETISYPAIPIFMAIVERFKHINFQFSFCNKSNAITSGEISTKDGKIIFQKVFPNFSKEAFLNAFKLNPSLASLFYFDKDKNTYIRDTSKIKTMLSNDGFFRDTDGTMVYDAEITIRYSR